MGLEKRTLTNAIIEIVDRYWSSYLGCSRETLDAGHTLILPHATGLRDYHGIFMFLHDELLLVSVPEHLLDAFRPRAAGWSQADVLQKDRLRHLVGGMVEQVIGPAFVGYTEGTAFRPAHTGGTRLLGQQDVPALAAFRAACSALEWEHGGSQLDNELVVGAHAEEQLVAVAGYTLWGGMIAHLAVITHPQYRGQGYGRAVVSRLTAEVLSLGLVPQYRTLEANASSMAIAHALGFERYATTVAVRLKPDAS